MTKIGIKEEILLFNYTPSIPIINNHNKLQNLQEILKNLNISERKNFIRKSTLKKEKKLAYLFFNHYFKLHEIKAFNLQKLEQNFKSLESLSVTSLATLYNTACDIIDPFNLTINLTDLNTFFGEISLFDGWPLKEELLKKADILFLDITLSSRITNITATSYVHELVHTQLYSLKGVVKNYYYSEVLPIFLELVCALENDSSKQLLLAIDKYRYDILLECTKYLIDTKDEDLYLIGTYFVSTLIAYDLFNKYYLSNDKNKKLIMKKIQEIFDNKISLDEFLTQFEINDEVIANSSNIEKIFKR